jgi:hypothetical protein
LVPSMGLNTTETPITRCPDTWSRDSHSSPSNDDV